MQYKADFTISQAKKSPETAISGKNKPAFAVFEGVFSDGTSALNPCQGEPTAKPDCHCIPAWKLVCNGQTLCHAPDAARCRR